MKQAKIDEILASVENSKINVAKDLARFHLNATDPADVREIAENYAASNLGLTCKRDLHSILEEGFDPEKEIKAWARVTQAAYNMVEKMKMPLTNENVVLMTNHKKAFAKY